MLLPPRLGVSLLQRLLLRLQRLLLLLRRWLLHLLRRLLLRSLLQLLRQRTSLLTPTRALLLLQVQQDGLLRRRGHPKRIAVVQERVLACRWRAGHG